MKGRCIEVSLYNMQKKDIFHKKTLPGVCKNLYFARIFWKKETSQCACLKGSLTVEASIIIPIMAVFFSFLLFFFRIMQVQLEVQNALEETGQKLAMLSIKELEEEQTELDYGVMAKGILYFKLKDNALINHYVSLGAAGVSLLASEYDDNYISLNADYVMHFPIQFLGNKNFLISQKTRFRKWNGRNEKLEKDNPTEFVYVTEHGKVYHIDRSCTYLELSIQTIPKETLAEERNSNGEIYKECELCSENKDSFHAIYITNHGNAYHTTLNCSGLKRTIYQKKRSEVEGMDVCMKCLKQYLN